MATKLWFTRGSMRFGNICFVASLGQQAQVGWYYLQWQHVPLLEPQVKPEALIPSSAGLFLKSVPKMRPRFRRFAGCDAEKCFVSCRIAIHLYKPDRKCTSIRLRANIIRKTHACRIDKSHIRHCNWPMKRSFNYREFPELPSSPKIPRYLYAHNFRSNAASFRNDSSTALRDISEQTST